MATTEANYTIFADCNTSMKPSRVKIFTVKILEFVPIQSLQI